MSLLAAIAFLTVLPLPGRWRVDVPGGELEVARDDEGRTSLSGPAVIVARGVTSL